MDLCHADVSTSLQISRAAQHSSLFSIRSHDVCDFPNCTTDYKGPDALRAYNLSHTDDPTPYRCDVDGCDKAYISSGMLGQHKKTHSVWTCDSLVSLERSITRSACETTRTRIPTTRDLTSVTFLVASQHAKVQRTSPSTKKTPDVPALPHEDTRYLNERSQQTHLHVRHAPWHHGSLGRRQAQG
jgi:hypothetical protein